MKTIETTAEIHASPDEVWETLVDFESYPDWNPFVTAIEGTPEEGERLRVRIDPPRQRAMTFRPRVTAAVPGERLAWRGRLGLPGLFDGHHEFRLEPMDGGRTGLVHRESFSGLLVRVLLNEENVRDGFEAMNEALAERVEWVQAGPQDAADRLTA